MTGRGPLVCANSWFSSSLLCMTYRAAFLFEGISSVLTAVGYGFRTYYDKSHH